MEHIYQLLHEDMQILNDVIRKNLKSEVYLVSQIGEYIISAGGKRIRPLLTLLCGKLLGFHGGTMLHEMAAMIEFIHTATLLHDDVVDESELRRGFETANAKFGNPASVLVGDFIYTRAFQMMVTSKSVRVLDVMANATNIIAEGEVLQLLNIAKVDLTEDEYFAVISSKTAKLFESAARVAAIITGAPSEIEDKLANYAVALGTAFQISDDILDYNGSSESMGKNIGDDLKEGKITLPLLFLLQHGTEQEQQLIKDAIINHNDLQQEDLSAIIAAVKQSDALKYCNKIAQQYVDQAIMELSELTHNEYKQALLEMAHYAISRIA